jgi:hypothetical protein
MRQRRTIYIALTLIALLVSSANAQTPPTNIAGTGGTVTANANSSIGIAVTATTSTSPDVSVTTGNTSSTSAFHIFNSSSTELLRVQSNGRVGIGTPSPANLLHLYSTATADGLSIDGSTSPAIVFRNAGTAKGYIGLPMGQDNYFNGAAPGDITIRSETGSIHIGRCCAAPTLTVAGPNVGIGVLPSVNDPRLHVAGDMLGDGIVVVTGTATTVRPNSASLDYVGPGGGRILVFGPNPATPATFSILLKSSDNSLPANGMQRLYIDTAGNVGIGTNIPTALLHVAGSAQVDGNLHVNGSITGTTVIGAVYQDVAEWVPSGQRLLPGTVVTINTGKTNEVLPSNRAYDTSVAGVVSEKPGVLLGVEGDTKSQIATTGRVRVHVDATTHPIVAGDLLVTSSKPGMAMYSEPVDLGGVKLHRPGTIIGKALEPLPGGEGDILVLLSLQ